MARRTLFTDPFTRADVNPLDGSWAAMTGTDPMQLVGNRCRATVLNAAVDNQATHTGSLPNDQWAKIVIRTSSVIDDFASVGVRWASASQNGYVGVADVSSQRLFLQSYVSGTPTNLGGGALAQALVDGDELLIEATGTSPNIIATLYLNGVQKRQGTGQSDHASGRAWIELYPTTDLAQIEIDDFASGDFAFAPPSRWHQLAPLVAQ